MLCTVFNSLSLSYLYTFSPPLPPPLLTTASQPPSLLPLLSLRAAYCPVCPAWHCRCQSLASSLLSTRFAFELNCTGYSLPLPLSYSHSPRAMLCAVPACFIICVLVKEMTRKKEKHQQSFLRSRYVPGLQLCCFSFLFFFSSFF